MDKEDDGWIPLQNGWIVMRDEQSEGLPIAITLESGDRIQFRQHPDGTTSARRVPRDGYPEMAKERKAMITIEGHCPECGGSVLALVDGKIECTNTDCRNPAAAHTILADDEVDHVVHFTPSGFAIRHPLRERIENRLLTCDLHTHLAEFAPNYLGFEITIPGSYRVGDNGASGEDWGYTWEDLGIPGS